MDAASSFTGYVHRMNMTSRSVCTVVLLVLFVTVVHSTERSLLGNFPTPKTTDLPNKQETGAAKTIPPPPAKKQETVQGRTAATGSAKSKPGSATPGQGARSADVGVARTVTPVRTAPIDLGHRRALLDTPPAQKATADAAAPKKPTADAAKKEESGAAKTTPPKTTTASDSKQQEAAKGRVAGSASNSTKQGSTAPGQAARRGDVGVAGTINPIKAVPFELGHRRALLGTSPGAKKPAADAPANKDKPADTPKGDETADLSKRTTKPTSNKQEAAKGRSAATGPANSKPGSTTPGQGARSADVGVARTVIPVRAAPEVGHRRALLGTSPAPKPASATAPKGDKPVDAAKKPESGAAKTTTPAKKEESGAAKTTTSPKTTTPAKTESSNGRTAPAGAAPKTTTPAESGARPGIGKFDYVLPGDPLAGRK